MLRRTGKTQMIDPSGVIDRQAFSINEDDLQYREGQNAWLERQQAWVSLVEALIAETRKCSNSGLAQEQQPEEDDGCRALPRIFR